MNMTLQSSVPIEIDYLSHEALDRASLAASFVCSALCDHAGINQNPRWKSLAQEACDALNRLYQEIGSTHP